MYYVFGGQNDTTNGGNLQSGQGLVWNMIEQMFGAFIIRNDSFLLDSDFQNLTYLTKCWNITSVSKMLIRPSQREAPITVKCCRAAADFQYYYEHYVYSILTMMSAWLKHSALECSNDPLLCRYYVLPCASLCACYTAAAAMAWRRRASKGVHTCVSHVMPVGLRQDL